MAKEDYKGIWIFAEQEFGVLHPTVFELIAKSKELQKFSGEKISAVLLGNNVASLADTLFEYGADEVILAESEALAQYSARPYQAALTQLVEKHKPSILIYGATALGRDLAPRLMISLKTGLTADAINLGFDEDGMFYQTTPAYGGKILAQITIPECRPQMATVHAGICEPLAPVKGAKGILYVENIEVEADADYEVIERKPIENLGRQLTDEKVVIAGGRGIKGQEDLAMLEELAELLDGQVASSRPLVDNGWLPHEKQLGQSGITVKPDLIFNIAISGSVQYLLGMQNSKCIVAINQSEDAPIFDYAHYGIVSDYKKFLPAFIAELRARKS